MRGIFFIALAIVVGATALPVRAGTLHITLGPSGLGGAGAGSSAIILVDKGPNWNCSDSSTPKCCLNRDQRRADCEISTQACHNKGGGVLSSDQSVPAGYSNLCKY